MKIISTSYKITTFVIALAFASSAINPSGIMEWCKEMMSMHASMEMHHDMDVSEMEHEKCEKSTKSSENSEPIEKCHSTVNCIFSDTPFTLKFEPKLITKPETGKVIFTFHEHTEKNLLKVDRVPSPFIDSSYSPSDIIISNQSFLI